MLRALATSLLAIALVAPAFADPPAHAPAWGRRAKDNTVEHPSKGHGKHRGYTGAEWVDDYGVATGHCNTEAVLTAAGAVTGAVIGNQVAGSGNRAVATLVGAIAGGIIGNRIGDAMDDRDRACIGHSLEIVPVGREVEWVNPASKLNYTLRPVRDLPDGCRLFEYRIAGQAARAQPMTACRSASGVWSIRRG